VVSLIVDEQGNPQRMTIVRPLGHGFLERLYALLKARCGRSRTWTGGRWRMHFRWADASKPAEIRWLH
jgi:hypothetical protein